MGGPPEPFILRHRTGIIVAAILFGIAVFVGYGIYQMSLPLRLW